MPSTDSDDCDPGPLTEQIIKIIVEDCENENPPQVDSSFDQIFKDYPFLIKAIDPNACANEQITVYKGASGNLFYQIETELQTAVYSGEGNFLAIERANAPPLSDVYNYAEVLDNWVCPNRPQIEGCLDATACNYNPKAIINNNTCFYKSANKSCLGLCYPPAYLANFGCTDPAATNYSANAVCDDSSCVFEGPADIFDRHPFLLDIIDPDN